MKLLILGTITTILSSFTCNSTTAQTQENIESLNEEKNIIDLPEWFGDDELETIKKIEAQDSLDYSDYIQLAVSYAQLDSDSTKIGTLVEQALNANTIEACKSFVFLLGNQRNWKISSQYKAVVNAKLISFNCAEL